jgi:hypothetical protein
LVHADVPFTERTPDNARRGVVRDALIAEVMAAVVHYVSQVLFRKHTLTRFAIHFYFSLKEGKYHPIHTLIENLFFYRNILVKIIISFLF